ncbi:protein vacuoleless1, partial [Tanacetum coccineum]
MAGVTIAAEWQLLGDKYYRKPNLYTLQWPTKSLDLSLHKLAISSFSGPIALIRDDSKIVQLYAESALRKLRIFNSAGRILSESIWRNPGGRLIGLSWTDEQILLCITQD